MRTFAIFATMLVVALAGPARGARAQFDAEAAATALLSNDVGCAVLVDAEGFPREVTFRGTDDDARRASEASVVAGALGCVVFAATPETLCHAVPTDECNNPQSREGASFVTISPARARELVARLQAARARASTLGSGIAMARIGVGQAGLPGAEAALEETLQILGQIVVDRASTQAFHELQSRLRNLLGCERVDDLSAEAAYRSAGAIGDRNLFPNTCEVLRTLRLQDVAAAPEALGHALFEDATDIVLAELETALDAGDDAARAEAQILARTLVAPLVAEVLLPALSGERHGLSVATIRTVVLTMLAQARAHADDPGGRRLAAALATAIECLRPPPPGVLVAVALECNVDATLAMYLDPRDEAFRIHILSIATAIQEALAPSDASADDVAARAHLLVEALFDAACGLSDVDCGDGTETREGILLGSLQAFLHAAIDEDGARVLIALRSLLDHAVTALSGEGTIDAKVVRALRIVSALVTYAATYASDDVELNNTEARRALLDSMTREFTDRTSRVDEWVFSIGGSLSAAAGARFSARDVSFHGPVNLLLGASLSWLPGTDSSPGALFALSFFDLGGYVAWQDGPVVRTPDAWDGFVLTSTLGLTWGRQLPFLLALNVAYQPSYRSDRGSTPGPNDVPVVPLPSPASGGRADEWGAVSVYLSAGIHVPLFDLN